TGGKDFYQTQVLADVEDGACVLRLAPGMAAHVRQDGKVRKVTGQKHMRLAKSDYAHVEFGPVRYFIHYANQPNVELPRNTVRDVFFTSLLAVAAAAYVVL